MSTVYENRVQILLRKLWSKLGFALVLVFVISFAVRVFRLDFYSLWYDEVTTVFLLRGKTISEAFSTILASRGSETLHPLYYLILSAWMQIGGSSEWAVRFPSVVFGSCAAVVYALLLYQVGNKKMFAFSMLLIISPFLIWYAREARPYALIMFLTGLHFLFYLKLLVKPKSKMILAGLIVTGVLSIYSGILTGMLLAGEFVWSLFVRRKAWESVAIVVVILLALPLFWHGARTYLIPSSGRYYRYSKTLNSLVRVLAFPQEFLVARSLGPTPDEVRRLPLNKVIREKSVEIGMEAVAIVCISASLVAAIWSCRKISGPHEHSVRMIKALGFISVAVCLQEAVLTLITHFQLRAPYLAFLFGPLFVLGTYPIANSRGYSRKILFIVPLLALWIWSSGNQLFNPYYVPDDFKNAARIININDHSASQVVALCHGNALGYYGVTKPLLYFMESPEVTCETLAARLSDDGNPVWLVLNRPWAYPNFHAEDLARYFQVLQTRELPGISMWLLLTK